MIKPYGTQILIQPASKTQVLVGDSGTLCEYGKVIAVGDEVKHVKVGQTIGFLVWGISKLDVRDEMFYFLNESSDFILGYIEE